MPQYLRPVQDTVIGSWGPTPLHSRLSEITPDDTSLVASSLSPGTSDIMEVKLGSPVLPVTSGNNIIRYRYKKNFTGGDQINLTVSLIQGATVVATWVHANIDAVITAQQTLTSAQVASITDYSNLRLRFSATTL